MDLSVAMSDGMESHRGQGKGRNKREREDPGEEFEDSSDSAEIEDAQRTVEEIERGTDSPGDDRDEGGQASAGAGLGDFDDFDPVDVDDETEGTGTDGNRFEGQSTVTLRKEDLQDEETVRELVEQLNQNSRGPGLADGDIEQIRKLGEDNLTPDAPDHVNIDEGVEFSPLGYSGEETGASENAMWLVKTDDGDEMFVTLDNSSVAGAPIESGEMIRSLESSLSPDAQEQIGFPDIHIDREREGSVLEGVGANDSAAVSAYSPGDVDFDKDDYISAVSGKLLIGDIDIGGNVVTSSDGEFHPIDYDIAGKDLEYRDEKARQSSGLYGDCDSLWEKMDQRAQNLTDSYDFNIEDGDVKAKVYELAEEVDLDAFETSLAESPSISDRKRNNVVNNIKLIQEGDI